MQSSFSHVIYHFLAFLLLLLPLPPLVTFSIVCVCCQLIGHFHKNFSFQRAQKSIISIESALNWCNNVMRASHTVFACSKKSIVLSFFHSFAITVVSIGFILNHRDTPIYIYICICTVYEMHACAFKNIQIFMRFVWLYGLLTAVNDLECTMCTRVNFAARDEYYNLFYTHRTSTSHLDMVRATLVLNCFSVCMRLCLFVCLCVSVIFLLLRILM